MNPVQKILGWKCPKCDQRNPHHEWKCINCGKYNEG